jgi:hypothetical protein
VTLRLGYDAELQSDGTKFDAIHVGAAAETLPEAVCDLLAPNGRMMVPVGEHGGAQVCFSCLQPFYLSHAPFGLHSTCPMLLLDYLDYVRISLKCAKHGA